MLKIYFPSQFLFLFELDGETLYLSTVANGINCVLFLTQLSKENAVHTRQNSDQSLLRKSRWLWCGHGFLIECKSVVSQLKVSVEYPLYIPGNQSIFELDYRVTRNSDVATSIFASINSLCSLSISKTMTNQ